MGALTGNTVQSTYLDLVQLGKSGAGLPSHAGKEAALYDGAGYQILGRTAVRHWLDPDPDVAAGTWEFSTYGDATQAALETAGWSFTECTGVVSDGLLQITKTGAYNTVAKAELTVSLAGDFDYVVGVYDPIIDTRARTGNNTGWGFAVADSAGAAHGIWFGYNASNGNAYGYKASTYANFASGTAFSIGATNFPVSYLRIIRVSGTVAIMIGCPGCKLLDDNGAPTSSYGWRGSTQADASTFNKLILIGDYQGKEYPSGIRCYPFIRRYS